MGVYVYKCKSCGEVFDAACSAALRNKTKRCKCGGYAGRDMESELSQFGDFSGQMRDNPRWSDALGVGAGQEEQFKKRFPHLNLEFDHEGRCLVRNRHHKKQIMKARGYDEY